MKSAFSTFIKYYPVEFLSLFLIPAAVFIAYVIQPALYVFVIISVIVICILGYAAICFKNIIEADQLRKENLKRYVLEWVKHQALLFNTAQRGTKGPDNDGFLGLKRSWLLKIIGYALALGCSSKEVWKVACENIESPPSWLTSPYSMENVVNYTAPTHMDIVLALTHFIASVRNEEGASVIRSVDINEFMRVLMIFMGLGVEFSCIQNATLEIQESRSNESYVNNVFFELNEKAMRTKGVRYLSVTFSKIEGTYVFPVEKNIDRQLTKRS
jgi:hypothetical protein